MTVVRRIVLVRELNQFRDLIEKMHADFDELKCRLSIIDVAINLLDLGLWHLLARFPSAIDVLVYLRELLLVLRMLLLLALIQRLLILDLEPKSVDIELHVANFVVKLGRSLVNQLQLWNFNRLLFNLFCFQSISKEQGLRRLPFLFLIDECQGRVLVSRGTSEDSELGKVVQDEVEKICRVCFECLQFIVIPLLLELLEQSLEELLRPRLDLVDREGHGL